VELFQTKHRNTRHDDNSKQTTSREGEAKMISPEFPHKKQRRQVLGREMAYVEVGQGDPDCAVARQSYLVVSLAHLQPLGRCIAPDLIAWATPTNCLTVAPPRIASSSTAATSAASCVYLTM
jgi:hypothetical protein